MSVLQPVSGSGIPMMSRLCLCHPSGMSKPQPQFVTERLAMSRPSGTIDREKGIVYGVRIVNPESGNGRRYPQPVLKNAIPVYEGTASYWGHRKNPSDDNPSDKFGIHRNVREATGGGLESDLHFNPKHPHAEAFLWACENNPSLYALSHHARPKWAKAKDTDGKQVAESILEVASVDVVAQGGTTGGVFESLGETTVDPKAIAQAITDQAGLESFMKDFIAALPQGMDAMKAIEMVMGGMADAVPADEEDATESLKRRGKLGAWAAEALTKFFREKKKAERVTWAKEMCKKEGLKDEFVTESFVSLLTKSTDDAEAKTIIADRKELTAKIGSEKPRSSPAGSGSTSGKSAKDLASEFTVD